MTEGRHAGDADRRRRRNAIVIAAVVIGLLVFVVGYVLGAGGGENAASPSPTAATSRPSASHTPATGSASPSSSPEPSGDELPDGKYFVQLTDLQGGEDGPLLIRYDLTYFYTGDEANQIAASRGDETPVPNGVYIVNDNPKLRLAPLAEHFTVRYIPEGSGSETVPSPQDRFLAWLGETEQTDFPSKDSTYWWITIDGAEVTTIEQQYLP